MTNVPAPTSSTSLSLNATAAFPSIAFLYVPVLDISPIMLALRGWVSALPRITQNAQYVLIL
jgi:hypothetical protein